MPRSKSNGDNLGIIVFPLHIGDGALRKRTLAHLCGSDKSATSWEKEVWKKVKTQK